MDKETVLLLSKLSASNYMILIQELQLLNKVGFNQSRVDPPRLDLVPRVLPGRQDITDLQWQLRSFTILIHRKD
jgi:hypothetical protein